MYYEFHQETQEYAKNKESCTFLSFLTDFIICFLLDFLYVRVRKCLFFVVPVADLGGGGAKNNLHRMIM